MDCCLYTGEGRKIRLESVIRQWKKEGSLRVSMRKQRERDRDEGWRQGEKLEPIQKEDEPEPCGPAFIFTLNIYDYYHGSSMSKAENT